MKAVGPESECVQTGREWPTAADRLEAGPVEKLVVTPEAVAAKEHPLDCPNVLAR